MNHHSRLLSKKKNLENLEKKMIIWGAKNINCNFMMHLQNVDLSGVGPIALIHDQMK